MANALQLIIIWSFAAAIPFIVTGIAAFFVWLWGRIGWM